MAKFRVQKSQRNLDVEPDSNNEREGESRSSFAEAMASGSSLKAPAVSRADTGGESAWLASPCRSQRQRRRCGAVRHRPSVWTKRRRRASDVPVQGGHIDARREGRKGRVDLEICFRA
eukprot:scaffold1509_cov240-Pinguiococcus_pyrenoidosus.AAC.24